MLKKLLVLGAIAAFTFALAQNAAVVGAKGTGVARSGDGRIGEFDFHVAKITRDGEFHLEGRLAFASTARVNNDPVRVRINLHRLERLDVGDGRVCEFGGSGVMVLARPNGVHEVRGKIAVRVSDRRNPTSAGDHPDEFAINFMSPTSNLTYDIRGLVTRGDIVVFRGDHR